MMGEGAVSVSGQECDEVKQLVTIEIIGDESDDAPQLQSLYKEDWA